jgi:hypothetical protein
MSVLLPLEKALSARLKADTTLMALLPGGFHSGSAPQNNPRPYLVMSEPYEEPADTLDRRGRIAEIEFDAFSPAGVNTFAQVQTIMNRVELLLRTPLTLDDHYSARLRTAERRGLVDDDNTRHGFMRARLFTMETATI